MFFSKLFSFFSRTKPKNAVDSKVANNASPKESNKVDFNKKLIKGLMRDHKILLADFTGMINSTQTNNFENANRLLSVFAGKIVEHLGVENTELYFYLEFEANIKKEDKETMRDFRNEMSGIATAVTGFINSYTNDPISAKNKDKFLEDANAAATVLVDRINREESRLYPMYGQYKK